MNDYKHNTNRKLPGNLLLFPEPYPGESFYSVLCRYHVRSGNASDWYTSCQLFGYNSSLTSTLLTPFHLEMVKDWLPSHAEAMAKKMLHQNTAYNLYAINAIPSDLKRIQEVVEGHKGYGSYLRCIQPKLINPAGYLRFCPECASEQRKLYGEPYWQVLPQIDEVEYCPRHKVRIRNSEMPLAGIRFHYHPASSILTKQSLMHPNGTCCQEWDSLYKEGKEFFIQLSCNIEWLLKNGEAYAGYKNLARSYKKMDRLIHGQSWVEIRKQKIRNALFDISQNNDFFVYLNQKNPRQIGNDFFYLFSLRLCSHVLIMTALCGTPKAFYEL